MSLIWITAQLIVARVDFGLTLALLRICDELYLVTIFMVSAAVHLQISSFMSRGQAWCFTALSQAASEGHTECLRLLLEAGADKDTRSFVRISTTVFRCAHVDYASFCLKNGALTRFSEEE